MVRKSQISFKKAKLKKDTGTSFESEKNCKMIKMKFGNGNFSFQVFQFLLWKGLLLLTAQKNTNYEWIFEKQSFSWYTKQWRNRKFLF